MITPGLEKLILEGEAEYKTFSGGWSSLMILNVPNGKFIVITDININFGKGYQLGLFDTFLQLQTSKKNSYFCFKTVIEPSTGKGVQQPQNLNTFLVFTEDVRIRTLGNVNAPLATDYNLLSNKTLEPPPPAGFGVTIPVTKRVTFFNNEDYIPQSFKYTDGFASATKRNEYFLDVVLGNELPAMISDEENFIINLGYVIVNKPYTNQLN